MRASGGERRQFAELVTQRSRRSGPGWCITGVPCRPARPRSAISGRSCSGGREQMERPVMSRARAATGHRGGVGLSDEPRDLAPLTWPAAPGRCRSPSASCASWWFWRGQDLEHLVGVPNAGLARWMTALRSEPRAASPVPNSSMITASDSRTGSVEMSWTMSVSTGELVRVTGSKCCRRPGPEGAGAARASRRSRGCSRRTPRRSATGAGSRTWRPRRTGRRRRRSMEIVTAARLFLVDPQRLDEPTLAPAIRTSSPWAANEASSKRARTR